VFLGLGSNIGKRQDYLTMAREKLRAQSEIQFIRSSPVYETSPWGVKDQPCFLNQVIEIETALRPWELLQLTKRIERKAGRQIKVRWGPRTLDIDILLYGNIRYADESIRIPHPHLNDRRFVLEPLARIAPDLWIPGQGVTAGELLAKCRDLGQVNVYQSKSSHDV
jgi:2-amino-4-hydroxy-6-hydroxymethyldihydropteridine diphosphokinase